MSTTAHEVFAASEAADLPRGTAQDRHFLLACALLLAVTVWGTVYWCGSMADGMPMPGGWTMSMAWMRMPGQTWLQAAASFMGMWVLMMVAMMLPSLVPMLSRYRAAVRADEIRLGVLTTVVGTGYFLVWTIVGALVYPIGLAVAAAEMQSQRFAQCVPFATGFVLLLAGAFQLTPWKARHLACCRCTPTRDQPLLPNVGSAWRHGLRLGRLCASCCTGLMLALLVGDVMNLGTMALIAVAITAERLMPQPQRVAGATATVLMATGVFAILRACAAH
ncbi:MAG: DUF2182 domain-containing protein [Deltaproteobacteria bacterium]|nr:DUF2182 domain-containing protein [Deltaproteobacteria bacterium]